MGNADLTDGIYLWPEGLAVYVDRFQVKLPPWFMTHMIEHEFSVPEDLDLEYLGKLPVDYGKWTRWGKGQSFLEALTFPLRSTATTLLARSFDRLESLGL